ncbi:MAG: GNAT family N-acetyltransferase, partial [Planctomycetota bacterium]
MSPQDPIAIRPAETGDAEVIAALLGELGHPQTPDVIRQRLEELAGFPSTHVLVATNGGEVIGVGTLNFMPLLHEQKIARVSALAVAEHYHGKGAG